MLMLRLVLPNLQNQLYYLVLQQQRDLGGSGVNIALRNAINAGKIDGPRIYTAGKSLATTGGHADPTNGYKKTLIWESWA